ncbi:MAG: bifunctional D-glycero-beta-D-manno-heptose-7-phosphate kinase/D-glycero-beta-D-manno-heptose 1-phosphate adenylyltransferase HldE [Desulfosudaceae bacterium]
MTLHCPDFSATRVIVAGDVMLDVYYWGEVGRISPEAPVPVVGVASKTHTLGGAGNVALNLAGLGCPVSLVGVCGDDPAGRELARLLAENRIDDQLAMDAAHITTTKTRIMGQGQQLLRLDEERRWQAAPRRQEQIRQVFAQLAQEADAAILSDYGKGFFAGGLAGILIAACRDAGIPVFVDPKGSDWSVYTGATCVTPNTRELGLVRPPADDDEADLARRATEVIAAHRLDYLLVTRGSRGMSLFGQKIPPVHIPTAARDVYDVSGAGDTVVSVAAAAFAGGLPMAEAAALANCAAGIVVEKVGTSPVSLVELSSAVRGQQQTAGGKLFSAEDAQKMIAVWRRDGGRIVFTNGCFDLLHAGHVKLLHAAAREGDRLVVGLNSDASVRRLKGPRRPVLPESERAALLAAIGCVDMVVVFDEETPLSLIAAFQPDVLVKGGDYTPETVVGREIVEARGGRICLVPLKEGVSTTEILEAVKKNEER